MKFLCISSIFVLCLSCSSFGLKHNGIYEHRFKGGHSRTISFENDTILRLQNNVSMMSVDMRIPCDISGRIISVSQKPKDSVDEIERLVYPPSVIRIKNSRTLYVDSVKYKFRRR